MPNKEHSDTENFSAYVMGYFTESPDKNGDQHSLHLAYSFDARNWIPFNQNQPVLEAEIGEKGMRDPFIFRKEDGSFVVLATNMWNSEYILCYDSEDLIHFTDGRLLQLNDNGMHAWAPEVIYDPDRKQYAIFWSGNTDRNRIYVNYTEDFQEVSEPEVLFDPGYNVIDASIIRHDAAYYMYFKDERDPDEPPFEGKRMKVAKSTSLQPGSFDDNVYGEPVGDPMIEGSMIIKDKQEEKWYLYGDNYYPVNGKFYAWETTDLKKADWKPLDRRDYDQPLNAKHASALKVTEEEIEQLIEHWGDRPEWVRIKSWSNPDCYLRHEDGFAKLAAYPFDPFETGLWKAVPGLADPDGVSFESVTHPNHYLKPYRFVLRLEENDGSETFKEEATFTSVEDPENPLWSSFASYKHPDKCIIHDGSFLRLSTISNNKEKQEATFTTCW